MIGRERRRGLDVGADVRAQKLGELDAPPPRLGIARYPAGENQGPLGAGEQGGGLLDGFGRRRGRRRRRIALDRPARRWGRQRLLLDGRVEIDVDRAAWRGAGDLIGAHQRLLGGAGRGRLVVPLGVRPNQRALVARGMDPVDPGAPAHRVDRTGGAEHDHGQAIAPGVEDRHGAMHQPDVAVQDRGQRLARHLGVAVADRDRMLLVQHQQHLRRTIAQVVDQAVVQAAIAGAGIERDVRDLQVAQHVGDDVAAPGLVGRRPGHGTIDLVPVVRLVHVGLAVRGTRQHGTAAGRRQGALDPTPRSV